MCAGSICADSTCHTWKMNFTCTFGPSRDRTRCAHTSLWIRNQHGTQKYIRPFLLAYWNAESHFGGRFEHQWISGVLHRVYPSRTSSDFFALKPMARRSWTSSFQQHTVRLRSFISRFGMDASQASFKHVHVEPHTYLMLETTHCPSCQLPLTGHQDFLTYVTVCL